MIGSAVRGLYKSDALRVAAVYSIAGAAFAGGTLLLARALPKPEYGLVGLLLALLNFASRAGPLGADGMVNRNQMDPGPALLRRVVATSAVFGLVLTASVAWMYALGPGALLLVFFGTVTGGAAFVASAQFQSQEQFGVSMLLNQGNNFVLLLAGVVVLAFGVGNPYVPVGLFVGGSAAAAILGWGALFRTRSGTPESPAPYRWSESLSYAGVSAVTLLHHHLDRFLAPELLSLEALATLTVLMAIVGAPFHMLELGVGFTLLPRLKNTTSRRERRRLVRHEGLITFAACVGAIALLLTFTPMIVRLFTGDKYLLPLPLILAACMLGTLRLVSAYAKTIIKAIGTTGDLVRMNVFAWCSIGLAIVGAAFGARWGLGGLLYGLGAGWVGHSVAGFALGARHLREPATQPAADFPHRRLREG